MDTMRSVAQLKDCPEGQAVAAQLDGVELVVLNVNGTVTIFEGRCPHQGTLLAEGSLSNGILVCRAHGWRFDGASGSRVDDPHTCLKQFGARVEDGRILVNRDEVLAWKQRQQGSQASPSHAPLQSLHQLPGPRGLPLVGNSLQIDMPRFHLILEQWSQTYGPLFTIHIGRKPMLVVADANLAHEMLRDRPERYRRLHTVEPVLREIGINGVFSAEGDNWRRQRHLVMQALDTRHLRQFFPTLTKVTQRLQTRWQRAAAASQPVDAQKDLMRYTVDVTTNLAFGYDMNTLEEEGDVIQRHLEKIFPVLSRRVFAPFPYWRYLKLPSDRALDHALVEVRKAIMGFIAHSRERLAHEPSLTEHPTNLLEAMLVARDDGDAHFSDDEIVGNAFTMLLAGEDTTANTLAWAMHLMTQHPDVQQRMQAEVDAVVGTSDLLQKYEAARQLVYVEAVVQETMRLKPVAPILALETNVASEVGGVHLPPETSITLLMRPGVMQESDFPQAERFMPERWLQPSESASPHIAHHKAFMPFGSGPRLCPGRSLALLEMKTALSMVCRHFDLASVDQGKPVGERFAFSMMPTHLAVRLQPRRS